MKHGCVKILFFLVAVWFRPLTLTAQNINYSNWVENSINRNPATAANWSDINLMGYYRNQWPGTSDFVSYSASALVSFGRTGSAAGFTAIRDVQGSGLIAYTMLSALYSYRFPFARYWQASCGLQVSYSAYTTQFSNLTFENNNSSASFSNESRMGFGFASGIELSFNNQAWYGLSFQNPVTGDLATTLPGERAIDIHYRSRIRLAGSFQGIPTRLEPSLYLQWRPSATVMLSGTRFDMNKILAGLYFRNNLRLQFDAAIILLGTRFGNSTVFYCYDINLSNAGSQFTSLAAHEVTFSYRLKYNGKSKKKGAIKCPKF